MTEKVGDIFYEIAVDTSKMIAGQREAEKSAAKIDTTLTATAKASRTLTAALELEGKVAREMAKAQTDAAIATARFGSDAGKAAISAKQLAQATRGLPAQFTDIFTSIASGQNPMTVLLQQGGQIKDMFGGIAPAARAVGSGLLAMIGPVTAGAAVVGALVAGWFKGRQEAVEFNRAIELTGNISGVTASQLEAMAGRMDALTKITRGQAAAALTEFVNQGVRGGAALETFATAAIRLEQAGGPSVQKTAEAFKALEKDPLNAAVRLTEQTGFMTVELYKQIRALEQQGKFVEAARVAQSAYADALLDRAPRVTENLGFVEKAWRAIVGTAKKAWDAMLGLGRQKSIDDQIAEIEKKISDRNKRGPRNLGNAFGDAEIPRLKAQLDALRALRDVTEQQAAADAKRAQAVKDLADADKSRKQGSKFDGVSYLIQLQERLVDAATKIDLIEKEELRKNDERLREREISQKQHEAARLLIIANAGKARAELAQKELQDVADREERLRQKIEEIEKRDAEKVAKGRKLATDAITGGDEIGKLQAELQERSAALLEAAAIDQANAELYAQARVALEAQTNEKIRQIRQRQRDDEQAAQSALLTGYSSLFDALAGATETFAGKQNGLYRTLFAASKAFAIADSIIKIQQGIANAASLPYPANLAAMAQVVASTASIVSTISSTRYGGGRMYGGPAASGTLYRVNESGAPEMFTAANGNQFMLPTSGGRVSAAGSAGGGSGVTMNVQVINQHPAAAVDVQRSPDGQTVKIAVLEVASQIRDNSGPVWAAMRGATNVQGRF